MLVVYLQQAEGSKPVPWFYDTIVLQVPKGQYVEMNFTMYRSSLTPGPCLRGYFLEVRDGNNQAGNVLAIFCGDYLTGVVRSSGRYMWLTFSVSLEYLFSATYTGKLHNVKGTCDALSNYWFCLYLLLIAYIYHNCCINNIVNTVDFMFWILCPAQCIVRCITVGFIVLMQFSPVTYINYKSRSIKT